MPILCASGLDGKVRAVVANYACHCTTLGGDFNKFCGDWAGLERTSFALTQVWKALDFVSSRVRDSATTLDEVWTGHAAGNCRSALQRTRASLVLKLLIDFLQYVLRLILGGEARLAEPEDLVLLRQIAQRMDPERLLEVLERCLEGDAHIDRRVQLVLLLEALLDALGQQLKA